MTKNCCYRGCRNDSRYLDPTVVKGATFYPFPKKKRNLEKCKRWLRAIGKDNLTHVDQVKRYHHVCNYHFVGGMGPTDRNPDPIPYEPTVIKVIETKPGSFSATIADNATSSDIVDTSIQEADPIAFEKSVEDREILVNLKESSRQIDKLKSLDDMLFKFWEYQVKNPRNQLMWCGVKDHDSDTLIFKQTTSSGNIRSVSVKIHNSFEVKVEALGHLVLKLSHHEKYLNFTNNLELLSFLLFIDSCSLCGGIMEKELSELSNVKNSFSSSDTNSLHSLECELLYNDQGKSIRCKNCSRLRRILARILKKRKLAANSSRNIKRNYLNDEQKKDLKKSTEIRKLKKEIEGLNKKIESLLNKVKENLGEKDQTIFNDIIEDNPFVTKENFRLIMLKHQMDFVSRSIKRPRKWNDSIIKWCLYIRSKSPAAYKALREVFTLPAPRTLFHYTAAFSGKSGFSIEVIKEMRAKIDLKNVEEHQKYFSVIVDEMKIKEDLVYKASTGELVGFCHLNEAGDKLKEEENKKLGKDIIDPPLATHVMTVMVRGITTNFKHILGYFPCHNMTAEELYSIIEEAIEVLENNHFKVLTVICDKSSINQKVIKMSTDPENGVYYKCQNTYAPVDEPRPIFFISDPPHLIKTVRNCFANSGQGKPRFLKKNGKHILWSHVQDMYNKDCQSQLRLCPKLTNNHISLGPFYAMRVKLATQIMSKTVATAIKDLVGDEASETVKFITIFNQFFDVLNTKNLGEGKKKRNKNLEPFSSLTDCRFKWLKEEFLGYLKEWKDEVDECTDISPEGKNMMLLSRETLEGIHTTVHSVIGAVTFLINKGAKFVLTNKLNQDPLEQHFGKHRRAVGSHENPDLLNYGYSERKFKILKPLIKAPKNGNCSKFKN